MQIVDDYWYLPVPGLLEEPYWFTRRLRASPASLECALLPSDDPPRLLCKIGEFSEESDDIIKFSSFLFG